MQNLGSVLYIAAHPDDENTAFIAKSTAGLGMRTGYLSLTRGSGGQNLLGSERGDLLGVIRTEELLAARSVDKGVQFFTRAVDFGYSKEAEESLSVWGREALLEDVVWVIRLFRPDVIVTRFEPQNRGHGHHKASAILAAEAYTKAADPSFAAAQLRWVEPWQALRLVHNKSTWFKDTTPETRPLIRFEVSGYNPFLGVSYGALAAQSRSMHKSQGFGTSPKLGRQFEEMVHLDGARFEENLFDGVDTSWARFENGAELSTALSGIIRAYDPQAPWKSAAALLAFRDACSKVKDAAWSKSLVSEAERLAVHMLGLRLRLKSDSPWLFPGVSTEILLEAVNQSEESVLLRRIKYAGETKTLNAALKAGRLEERPIRLSIPDDTPFSNPHWLAGPKDGSLYGVRDLQKRHVASPLTKVLIEAELQVAGESLQLSIPLTHTRVDPVRGEITRHTAVVPRVSAAFDQPLYVASRSRPSFSVGVHLRSFDEGTKAETLRLLLPEGWSCEPKEQQVRFSAGSNKQELSFTVRADESLFAPQSAALPLGLAFGRGSKATGYEVRSLTYAHIPEQSLVRPAKSRLLALDAELSPGKIGYIPGPGDEVPAVLKALGYEVKELGEADIAAGRLAEYSAVLFGIRALNTHPWLQARHPKLMNYVEGGGTLVVQYSANNRLGRVEGPIGPYPFTIGRTRVVDEEAEVQFNNPEHLLLREPNRIDAADFKDWVQERGLYFAEEIDGRYDTPLSMKDAGEDPSKGSLLYARFGRGRFIYTGLSFFRQLPEGNPGALRLFLNLLEREAEENE